MYQGNSIVDYLKSTGQDSSYAARSKLAASAGITDYSGTAEQNTLLLNNLRTATQPTTTNQPQTVANPVQQPMNVSQPQTAMPLTPQQQELNAISQQQSAYTGISQQAGTIANQAMDIQKEQIQKNTDFNIAMIEKQKAEADKALLKEGVAADVDYQKLLNPYGVQAEQRAAGGFRGANKLTESSKVSAYNATQNRIATALETTNKIKADFDLKIDQAMLNKDSLQAELYLKEFDRQIEQLWKDFEFTTALEDKKIDVNRYWQELEYQKQQDAEEKRRYEEETAYQKEQDRLSQSNWEREFAESKRQSAIKNKTYEVETPYYRGDINPNVKYGTFNTVSANGVKYQPNNVGQYKDAASKTQINTLSASGITVGDYIKKTGKQITGWSGADLSNQKVWQDKTGNYWYWDGSINDYKKL